MDDARNLYDSIENYRDIEKLLGTQESIYIDFKQTQYSDGRIGDGDKAHFSKAASGFAHQEGGVIVWGIDARKDENEVNFAKDLKPICNIGRLCSEFWDYTKHSTEPVVDGIDHKIIFEDDNEQENKGFIVSFFPKSDREHIAKGRNTSDFYKRHGDSFVPLSVSDIKALFFRNLYPDLELYTTCEQSGSNLSMIFRLENRGKGIAKNCAVYVYRGTSSWVMMPNYYYINPNIVDKRDRVSISHIFRHQNYTHIKLASEITLCPEETVDIATAIWHNVNDEWSEYFKYKIFAENMIPKEGNIKIEKIGSDLVTSTI